MRVTLMAGAVAGVLALAGCQSGGYPAFPDETAYSPYPGEARANAPLPPPPPPPAGSYPDVPAYSNQVVPYAEAPLPPASPAANQTPENGPGIRPFSDTSISVAMDEEEAALRSALARSGVAMTREGDNLILALFEPYSANLTAQGRDMIVSLSRVVQRYPSTFINVDGFTDAMGERGSNIELSQDRADAVADVLSAQGVESRRLSAVGHGADFPKVPTAEGVSEPRNRRVEITLEPYAG